MSTAKSRLMLILAAAGLAQICVTLDYWALTVALPRMATDLKVPTTELQWALSAYLLAFASLLVVAGRLGDIFGRKKAMILGLAIFGAASFLGGIAPSVNLLVAARAIQGVGGAFFFPTALAVVAAAAPDDRRTSMIGKLVAISAVGAAIGPFFGGWVTDSLGWRWIFYINLGVAALAAVVTLLFVPESRDETAPRRIDFPGLVTVSVGIIALVLVIDQGREWGWASPKTLGLLAVSMALLAAFVLIEKRVKHPLVELKLFANNAFASVTVIGATANFLFAWSILLLTLFMEDAQRQSPFFAGLVLLPLSVAAAVVSPRSGTVVGKVGPRPPMTIGLIATAVPLALYAVFVHDPLWPLILTLSAVLGAGCGMAYSATNAAALDFVPTAKAGAASGVIFTTFVVGAAFSVTIVTEMIAGFSGAPPASIAEWAYEVTFLTGAAIAAVAAVGGYFWLPRRAAHPAASGS